MQHRAEDYLRRSMNMPPRPGSREDKKRKRQQRENPTPRSRQRRQQASAGEPLIPKEYAEDVEYVEIKDYSETTIVEGTVSKGKRKDSTENIRIENQVSDVEWVEVKMTNDSSEGRK